MPAFGVYPIADVMDAGEEISSTYEGRHVTLLESELIHPSHTDGLVDKGDPVVFGTVALQGVGVAFKSAAAATDYIAIDTEGIWIIDVNAADDGGNRAIEGGDRLYINNSTAVVSAIATAATQVPFGYALGHIDSGLTNTIAVKVHWDPIDNQILDDEPFRMGDSGDRVLTYVDATDSLELVAAVLSADGRALKISGTNATPAMSDGYGMVEIDANVTGIATGWFSPLSSWANITGSGAIGANFVCAQQNGIYADAGANTGSTVIFGMRAQGILTDAPTVFAPFSLNTSNREITALFHMNANPDVGYQADATTDSNKIGDVPLFCDGAAQQYFVRIYDARS